MHGPHQSAQKSVTTMREDCRIWLKWEAEVTETVLDMMAVVVCVEGVGAEGECNKELFGVVDGLLVGCSNK